MPVRVSFHPSARHATDLLRADITRHAMSASFQPLQVLCGRQKRPSSKEIVKQLASNVRKLAASLKESCMGFKVVRGRGAWVCPS